MQAPVSTRILSDASDLLRLERDLRAGCAIDCHAVSIQIREIDPNLALATQKAINGACGAAGACEALATAVVLGGAAAGAAISLDVSSGSGLGATILAVAVIGGVLGRKLGQAHARRRALRAIKRLRHHVTSQPSDPVQGQRTHRTALQSIACLL